MTPDDAHRFDPDWLLEEAARQGHRMTPYQSCPERTSREGYCADYEAICTRHGCTQGLAYWETPPDARHELYRAWVNKSATLACGAAIPRSELDPALRQARRSVRRQLIAEAEALGHEFGPWQQFWLSWVHHTLQYEKRCIHCRICRISASLEVPAPDRVAEYLQRIDCHMVNEIGECTSRQARQLALF